MRKGDIVMFLNEVRGPTPREVITTNKKGECDMGGATF